MSFDDLVGAGEQNGRDRQTERLGGRQVDHELYLNRLLNRQLGGLRPAEDFVGEDARLASAVAQICPVAH